MKYCIAIELPRSKKQAFGVVVPDIPGCFSAGDTLEEAIDNARDAVVMQLQSRFEAGDPLPEPSDPLEIAQEYGQGWILWALEINPRLLSTRARRVNITLPEGLLVAIDEVARQQHTSRSAFLADAALRLIESR